MAKIGLLRCEKNDTRCPLTSCLKSLDRRVQGFADHQHTELVGVFTCKCPGDGLEEMAKILKSKGADVLHFCTCTFAHKEKDGWVMGNGLCENIDSLVSRASRKADIPCIKGTAHLPHAYQPERFEPCQPSV